jgi:DNA-binding transcriptional MerR regulator
MKIGEVARQTGVSKSIIRYYEDKGVLPRAIRDSCGYRYYGDAELARIRFVTSARRLGCSFTEIKALIAMQDLRYIPSSQILDLLSHKIIEVNKEMERLRQILGDLLRLQDLGLILAEPEAILEL